MGYRYHAAGEQAQRDKPILSIIEAAVYKSDASAGKYQVSVCEIQTVLGKVATVLRIVPLEVQPEL
jgi:hypothetical protein